VKFRLYALKAIVESYCRPVLLVQEGMFDDVCRYTLKLDFWGQPIDSPPAKAHQSDQRCPRHTERHFGFDHHVKAKATFTCITPPVDQGAKLVTGNGYSDVAYREWCSVSRAKRVAEDLAQSEANSQCRGTAMRISKWETQSECDVDSGGYYRVSADFSC